MSRCFELEAIDARIAGKDLKIGIVGIGLAHIELLGAIERAAQGQRFVEQIPFGTELIGLVLDRREAGGRGAQ